MTDTARSVLSIWTIFDHPDDHPDEFVARRFECSAAGAIATDDVMRSKRVELIRQELECLGLCRLERNDEDPPAVLESWL